MITAWLLLNTMLAGAPSDSGATQNQIRLAPIELTCVDRQATGYATFQSHNQKVLSNRRGIFMTYIRLPRHGVHGVGKGLEAVGQV